MSKSKKDKPGGHSKKHAPKWFRKMLERQRRARVKQAMKTGKEIPRFRKDADWNWW